MKLSEFLDEDIWCQGHYAINRDGVGVFWFASSAEKFSLLGALHKTYPVTEEYLEGLDRLASLIRIVHGKKVEEFNDSASWAQIDHIIHSIDL